jgi:hypothetical protein
MNEMQLSIRIFVFIIGVLFTSSIVRLLLAKKITERYSIFWFFGAFCILLLSIVPNFLDRIAALLKIEYPPTILFLIAILLLFWLTLYNSIQITLLRRQVVELTQQKAVAEAMEKIKEEQSRGVDQ